MTREIAKTEGKGVQPLKEGIGDREVLQTWLDSVATDSKATAQLYKSIANKLLWILENTLNLTIPELSINDIKRLQDLITNPTPDMLSNSNGAFKTSPSDHSRFIYLRVIYSAFSWLNATGYLPKPIHLFVKIRKPRKRTAMTERSLSSNQLGVLIDASLEMSLSPSILDISSALFFALLLGSSARAGELREVKWGDIFPYEDVVALHLRTTKNGEPREVILLPDIICIIESAKEKLKANGFPVTDNDYVFCKRNGTKFTAKALRDKLKRLIKLAEVIAKQNNIEINPLSNCTPHWIRHTSATLLASDINLKVLSNRLGHKSLTTTSVYLHTNLDDQYEGIKSFHILNNSG